MSEQNIVNNEKNEKVNFNEFINEIIIKNSNLENEINKNDLLNEIEEKVENGNKYINKININYPNEETLKISELKNILNDFSENKINPSDLDFLSKDLPKDKNRIKILKVDDIQPKRNKNKKKINITELIKHLEKKNLTKETSIIKPINLLFEFKGKNNLNKKSFSPILQERFKSQMSSYRNLVKPINKNNKINLNLNDPFSKEIENLKNKIVHKKVQKSFFKNENEKEDFFFDLYQNYSNQNQSLQILDNAIFKLTKKKREDLNNINIKDKAFVPTKKNELLTPVTNNNNLHSNLLNKINFAKKHFYSSKETFRDRINHFNESDNPILNNIKIEINKLSDGLEQNNNNDELDKRFKQLYKLNNNLNINSNDNIIQNTKKNTNKEQGIFQSNIFNDLL